jgi:mono/diheme cytochrome c family protein
MRGSGLLASALLVAACASARRGEAVAGPMTLDDAAVRRGQIVFFEHCHKCHPRGEAGLGPALNDKPFPGFLKRFQIRHGLGAMPSFPDERIGSRQLDDLLDYLAALRAHG